MEPGPGSYDIASTLIQKDKGAKIAETHAKMHMIEGSIDAQVKRSTEVPPPGVYDPKLLPTGEKTLVEKRMTIGEKNESSKFHHQVIKEKIPEKSGFHIFLLVGFTSPKCSFDEFIL